MDENKDIVVVADDHAEKIEYRWFNEATGEERTGRYPTTRVGILRQIEQARREVAPGGQVVWIMESTTGWARVKDLIGTRARFVLANVLQMPLPPKGRRRQTDHLDTGRILREYLHGGLPPSFQPDAGWRQVRRVVDMRQDLVERQTALKKWPGAQWVDAVRGLGMVTAVSVLARIGPIERFPTAEDLISYVGLAPGVRQSDETCHHGRIGGGGTDAHLRYLLIEASVWLRDIPRYRPTYQRVLQKRGTKIARIVVARLFLRSLHKMLKDRVRFNPARSPRRQTARAATTATAGI
jgi:hypothetical protein